MANARCVVDIMDKLLQIIPDNENVIDLRNEIIKYKETLWNQSPEALKTEYCWMPLQNIMNRNIREIDTEWKHELLKVFNNTK
jgi:hypothetical protein